MKKILCLCCAAAVSLNCMCVSVYADNEDAAKAAAVEVNARSAVLMEAESGELLFEMNKDDEVPIASVTKIMTMLLIMEAIDSGQLSLDDTVTASERAKSMGGSTMFLEAGEQLTVSDMLKGIAVASANDGAVAMAEHIAGSESEFVRMMNERAAELGMTHTQFQNTNGLDADGHYSSAHDVAIMSRELIKHEKIFEYTTIWMDELRGGKTQLANTNKLIRFYQGANGLKTGSTSKALCCLSATAKRGDMQLIAVVLGAVNSKERFGAASRLLDYGFAKYSVNKVVEKNTVATEAKVLKGTVEAVNGVYAESFSALCEKGAKQDSGIETKITLEENLTAPIEQGQKIGSAEFVRGGEVIGGVDIISECAVEKKTLGQWIVSIFNVWLFGKMNN